MVSPSPLELFVVHDEVFQKIKTRGRNFSPPLEVFTAHDKFFQKTSQSPLESSTAHSKFCQKIKNKSKSSSLYILAGIIYSPQQTLPESKKWVKILLSRRPPNSSIGSTKVLVVLPSPLELFVAHDEIFKKTKTRSTGKYFSSLIAWRHDSTVAP